MKCTLLVLSLFPLTAFPATISPKAGAVSFQATASPGALAIRGQGEAPTGHLELTEAGDKVTVSGQLILKIDSFKTGISLRDSHMKEKYLETGKYPEALLILSGQTLPKQGAGPFEGELVLHGVKHKVSGQAELSSGAGGARTVKASFPVKLTDHGITIPTFAGISVADQVNVETELTL